MLRFVLYLLCIANRCCRFCHRANRTDFACQFAEVAWQPHLGPFALWLFGIRGGSTEDSGSFTAQCGLKGSSQINLMLGPFSRSETRQTSAGTSSGSWTDAQGMSHAMAATT